MRGKFDPEHFGIERNVVAYKSAPRCANSIAYGGGEELDRPVAFLPRRPPSLLYRPSALQRQLAAGPTFAYGRIKHLMRTSHERTLHDQLDEERRSFLECNRTNDFESGVSAFLAKEKAVFRGS
jgi:enoyl-CoA hydratase/carnithine racemase